MKINDFIEELKQKEIEVSFSAGKLKYSGPEVQITPELIENLKKYKGKLLKHFWPKEFSNLMPINTEGNKIPIFIVHGDNGNYIISDHLGKNQPVYGFFHPGSDGESIRFKSVNDMAKSYLEKLLTLCPSGPYYLIGFSFGGVLAYEMAVQLQMSGHEVSMLVLIDSQSPLAKESIKWHNNPSSILRKNILGPLKRWLILLTKLLICKSYILRKKPIPIKSRKLYMLNKYEQLNKKYKPLKFSGDILLFRAKDNISSHKYLGWENLVNNINMVTVEANHTTIFLKKESVEILKTEIEKHFIYLHNIRNL